MLTQSPLKAGLIVALLVPSGANALTISEIFFDAPGTDDGQEWIEIFNEGGEAVDMTGWRLYENGVNHKLQGELPLLPPRQFAVIADDIDSFKKAWPQYSGALFDSAFSLKNTGEPLELRNADFMTVTRVDYDTSFGAAGDGNSLNFEGYSWRAAEPTPGMPASERVLAPPQKSEKGSEPKKSETRNLSVEPLVSDEDAIDGGGDGDILAASYAGTNETMNSRSSFNTASWIALVAVVAGIGIAAVFAKKRNRTGYEIIEEEP